MHKNKKFITLALVLVIGIAVTVFSKSHNSTNLPATTKSTTVSVAPPTKPAGFNKAQFSTTDPTSPWVVINKQHPLNPITYAPADLTSVGNGQQMRAEAASALQHMFSDAAAAGYTLTADSGYRSYATQVNTYGSVVKAYGQAAADTQSARAGYSEHQSGWAIDIGTSGCHLDNCFSTTPAGEWATTNAYKYGFILRYKAGLSDVTGYETEAWHFRYIGPALSQEMHMQNVDTLEQFFNISGGTTYK